MNNQNTVNIRPKLILEKRSFFSRFCLPVILLISFVWLNLYTNLADMYDMFDISEINSSLPLYLAFSVFILGVVEYLAFELFFFVYRLFLGFSIYSFMIPKTVLIDNFRKWYIFRNLILGFVFNLRFFFPYINFYLCVFELLMNFALIICLFLDLKKEYVEPLVGQHVFRTLLIPVLLYEAYVVISQVVGVLW